MFLINFFLQTYIFILIADTIFSYLPEWHYRAPVRFIKKLADFSLAPIRKKLPQEIPIDISPLIAISVIQVLLSVL
jgi:YggT family protein